MTSYKDTFNFNVSDINLIEQSVRNQIHTLSKYGLAEGNGEPAQDADCDRQIKQLHELLGKIQNQKIWYGQVNETKDPITG